MLQIGRRNDVTRSGDFGYSTLRLAGYEVLVFAMTTLLVIYFNSTRFVSRWPTTLQNKTKW